MYKNKARLVLASASPRRKELLSRLGLDFEILPSRNGEDLAVTGPADYVARQWARNKAREVANGPEQDRKSWYLGVDTVVVLGDAILGKPGSHDEARQFLERLSGRWHEVVSGYCILHPESGKELLRAVRSRVRIKRLDPPEIEAYINTDEPYDKAGAYAVQGLGAFMVESIEGSYTNVVGLPLTEVMEDLKTLGVVEVTGS